jgi:hypothetical protein
VAGDGGGGLEGWPTRRRRTGGGGGSDREGRQGVPVVCWPREVGDGGSSGGGRAGY